MLARCLAYATAQKQAGKRIVGIMCEYTPRELIMAAGGVPVCLCGGDVGTIPAAEEVLPANLCPLVKSTYGYGRQRSNPFLEMADLVVAETTCDGKKKMYELLSETVPVCVLELPQKEDDAAAFEHWLASMRGFRQELERGFGLAVEDEAIRAAIREMNRERRLRRELAELMVADPPPMTGRALLEMKSLISCIPEDLARYAADRDRLAAGVRPELAGRVRVLLTGVPLAHGAERVLDIIEASGAVVVCQENCTGLKPILEDVDEEGPDPVRALAEKYYHLPCSVMTRNRRREEVLRKLALQFRAEAVIELVWQACLTYDVESFRVRRLAETELRLPYLRIETDYSPSDSARIAVRVEALCETARQRRSR